MKKIKVLIDNSKNPYIYAGHGCALYRSKFKEFIEKMQIPVMLSWRAIDLITDEHPLNAGRPGLITQPEANKNIQQADLLPDRRWEVFPVQQPNFPTFSR